MNFYVSIEVKSNIFIFKKLKKLKGKINEKTGLPESICGDSFK